MQLLASVVRIVERHALRLLPFLAALVLVTANAHAEEGHGLAVVGLGHSLDVAWPLAKSVYADASLRPVTLDEPHARVLVGETPDGAASAELRDLADTRGAIRGDDAASRRLLQSIATSLHVKGIVVVEAGATATARPTARVFVTTLESFDAVRYEPDPSAPVTWGNGSSAVPLAWTGTVTALKRSFAANPPPPASAAPTVPAIALHAVANGAPPVDKGKSRAFYQSPWFWAAAGAAVFAAGAVYLATRSDSSDNIQLQVQVPK